MALTVGLLVAAEFLDKYIGYTGKLVVNAIAWCVIDSYEQNSHAGHYQPNRDSGGGYGAHSTA